MYIRTLNPKKSHSIDALDSKQELLDENRLLRLKLSEAEKESASRAVREEIWSRINPFISPSNLQTSMALVWQNFTIYIGVKKICLVSSMQKILSLTRGI